MNFSWTCPYCNRNTTIVDYNYSSDIHYFRNEKIGFFGLKTEVIMCPNSDCNGYQINACLVPAYDTMSNGKTIRSSDSPIFTWSLKPSHYQQILPEYIPKAIRMDYEEACKIKELSPKASATLSRRCLQGMIRDFWDIKKKNLFEEVNALEGEIDPITWQSIDAVRKIGNIGAHMEKDIDLIIDVVPQEAGLLIGLIELLIKDWYITKHDRDERFRQIIKISEIKEQEKTGS